MFLRDDRRQRRSDRPRRRPGRIAVEGLESRQLMAYSALGYSLPDLTVTGYAAQAAAWGGTLAVDVTVQNQGASSLIEPLAQTPTSTDPNTGNTIVNASTADSAATVVDVYAATKPNATSGLVKIDSVSIPAVTQNSQYNTTSIFTLPAKPKGFPSNGGKVYLTFIIEPTQTVTVAGQTPAFFRVPLPVKIVNPLPNLQVIGVDLPTSLQPGDVITPTIEIENFGAGDPAAQGTVTVDLVASLDRNFGPGDSIVGSYTISSLPGLSEVPTQSGIIKLFGQGAPANLNTPITTSTPFLTTPTGLVLSAHASPVVPITTTTTTTTTVSSSLFNLTPPVNVNVTTLGPLKLPTSPGFYYLGIEIDPTSSIKMTHPPVPALMGVVTVGPRSTTQPPATLLVNTSGVVPKFPALPSTVIGPNK